MTAEVDRTAGKQALFIYFISIASGAAILACLTPAFEFSREALFFIGVFSAGYYILMHRNVWVSARYSRTIESVISYAAIIVKGPAAAAWVSFIPSVLYEIISLIHALKKKDVKVKFRTALANFSNPFLRALVAGLAGIAYQKTFLFLKNTYVYQSDKLISLGAYTACVSVFLITSSFIGVLLFLSHGKGSDLKSLSAWKRDWRSFFSHLLVIAPLGMLTAVLYQKLPAALILLVIPVFIQHKAIKAFRSTLRQALDAIEFLAVSMDERDAYTYGHSKRVAEFAGAIAGAMSLPKEEVEKIKNAGIIHDLGKIAIPDKLLLKPGSLNDYEYSVMKSHTHTTAQLSESFDVLASEIPLQMAMYHHERYDGEGYIYGLKGDEIPLGSRILAVADTYDAITSDRPYRKALPEEEARRIICECAGAQLDPEVVDIFLKIHSRGAFEEIKKKFNDKNHLS